MLTGEQRKVCYRYADEVLYAIGMYLMSLEPPKNPNPAPREMVAPGEGIFRREGCACCHVPPAYTSGKLTLAEGWNPPLNHPNRDDIVNVSVGTDPGAALKTGKGAGLYKIPSLRGIWYRPFLLHDGSVTSLEEMFDPSRLKVDYEPKGWNPPGITKREVSRAHVWAVIGARGKVCAAGVLAQPVIETLGEHEVLLGADESEGILSTMTNHANRQPVAIAPR